MSKLFTWVETGGGPHLLLPEELLREWRGIENWHEYTDPNDNSDYARACRVDGWLGVIKCGDGGALVLGGDVGSVAWHPGDDQSHGFLIQWLGVDDEGDIYSVISGPNLAKIFTDQDAECVEFSTGTSGAMRLFDSAHEGDNLTLVESAKLKLTPGKYRARAGYIETDNLVIVVRELRRTSHGKNVA